MLGVLTGAHAWQPVMELAVLLDAGKPFYEETFLLEGDGFLAPFVFDHLQKLHGLHRHWDYANSGGHPNVRSVAHSRFPVRAEGANADVHFADRKRWIESTLDIARPAFLYVSLLFCVVYH